MSARTPGQRRGLAAAIAVAPLIIGLLFASVCAQARPGERVVHHEDGDNYGIWVVEREGTRYLRFERDGINQSAVRLGQPTWLEFTYTKTLLAAFAVAERKRRVLVVGLGGGTIPTFLRHVMPEAEIDVVELEPRVAAVAEAHLGFTPDAKLRVHIGDGRRFLEQSTEQWDVIVLDAYGPDAVPPPLSTREFLTAVRARLAPGGLVAANLWATSANRSYPSMLRTYEDVFPEVYVVRALHGASRIVVAPLERRRWTAAGAEAAARELTERWKLGFDLPAIVHAGYEGPGGHPSGGAVLRDE